MKNSILDKCDLCDSEDIYVDDYGYCLCYPCFERSESVKKEMARLTERENFQLGYEVQS